jgi:hypothetical protein
MTTARRRRTVFDLTPQELRELSRLNTVVSASVPPRRPGLSSGREFENDYGIYERYRDLHAKAKAARADWLREHRLNLTIAAQAKSTDYNPYAHAGVVGLVAPPMPEGYAEALLVWRKSKEKTEPRSRDLPPPFEGFSF